MTHPNNPDLSFSVDVHRRDNNDDRYSIHAVFYKNENITEFVAKYAPHLFLEWETSLYEHS
jgi:hypothetical protein